MMKVNKSRYNFFFFFNKKQKRQKQLTVVVVCGGIGMTDLRGEENAGKGGVVRVLLWVSLLRERERERGEGKADQGRNETMKVKRTTKKIHQLFFWWKILKLLSNFIIKKKIKLFF